MSHCCLYLPFFVIREDKHLLKCFLASEFVLEQLGVFCFFFNTQLTKYMVSSRKYSLCSREFTEVVASSPHRSASLPPCGESGSAVWPQPIVKQYEFCTRTPQRKPLLRVPRAWIADRASEINVQTPQMGKESLHTANTNFIQRKESSIV